jgi:peptidoglycan/LPS O-acetylase OafA/YrhL/lysophospholipase L1-like esterase
MSVFVIPPAFFYLLPAERVDLFKSVAATVTFTSNIFFWQQSGYFAVSANEKPMLHTWSLSVEEQFYLLLPILIWALLKWRPQPCRQRAVLLLGLGASMVASFALCDWLMRSGRIDAAFFLSPPRAWEFLVGSLIAIRGVPAVANIHVRRAIRILGFVLIAIAVIGYREGSFFPGIGALLPCAGAVLFIWSGADSAAPARAIWSPLHVFGFIGKISYSLYLWHWPLFVYLRFSKLDLVIPLHQKALLLVVTVAAAYISYRFVEQPFRQRRWIVTRRAVFAVAGCATAALLMVSVVGLSLSVRPTDMANPLSAYNATNYPSWYRTGSCFVYRWADFNDSTCLMPDRSRTNVLLWGDSLAAHYIYGLNRRLGTEVHLLQANAAACLAATVPIREENERCRSLRERVRAFVIAAKLDAVVIAGKWDMYTATMGFNDMIAALEGNILFLKGLHVPVIVIGPSPTFRGRLPAMLLRARARGVVPNSDALMIPGLFDLDRRMRERISHGGAEYVSVFDAVCPERVCPLLLDGGVPLTFDRVHTTAEGSMLLSEPVARAIRTLLDEPAG